jgi:Flp pilus assembly protein TadD
MAEGNFDEAYWWARNLLAEHPDHLNGYNTLGVVYQRSGKFLMAEKVFKAGLALEPENLHIMNNLIPVLTGLGRKEEADAMRVRLATIDPTPPFHYFRKGQQAMVRGDFKEAKTMFAKEVRRSPFYHEFHFWLAMAQLGLGDRTAAREQLVQAMETSNTKELSKRYSVKLEHLRALARLPYAMN